MSTVDEWARREAERRYPASWEDRGRTDRDSERDAFEEGADTLAALLLSDEALRAMQTQLLSGEQPFISLNELHHAVEAALTKITEDE